MTWTMSDADLLRRAGVRVTRPRLAVVALLRTAGTTHLTVEQTYGLAQDRGLRLTFSTLYKILNDLAKGGLVRRMDFYGRAVYCSNHEPHHHFLDEASGALWDIPEVQPTVSRLPKPPQGMEIAGVDVIVRLRPARDR